MFRSYTAVAQCCDFPEDANAREFVVRSDDDGTRVTAECPSNSVLTGCDVFYESGGEGKLLGSFTGDQSAPPQTSSWIPTANKCTAGARSGAKVSATAHCLETQNDYRMVCETKAQWTIRDGYSGCERGYQIMSCNTWTTSKTLDDYYVNGAGRCYVQQDNYAEMYANAVCCRLEKRSFPFTICTLLHIIRSCTNKTTQ